MFASALDFARRVAAGNRWLVIAFAVLIGLWATELLVERFVNFWPKLATMGGQIDVTNATNRAELSHQKFMGSPATGVQNLTKEQEAKIICADPALQSKYGEKFGCPPEQAKP